MEQFSIGLPMSIIMLNILFVILVFGIFFSIGYAIYRYVKGDLVIKVNNNLIEITLFCKSLNAESRPSSYLYKDINGREVFEVSRKLFSYILKTPTTNQILSIEGSETELKLNEPMKILHESSSEIKVTRLN
jgi:hypothetical protein